MLSAALTRALAQMPDPAFRRVLLIGLLLTLAALAVTLALTYWVVLPLLQVSDWEWLNWLAQAAGFAVVLIALFLLFPAIATVFVALFLDDIADAVERRHYPDEPTGKGASLADGIVQAMKFLAVALLLNLFLLLFLFIPPLYPFVFYGVNGYLLGREYFEMVAIRHLTSGAVNRLRRTGRLRVLGAGVVVAFLLTVPLVNLLAPLFATAVMVHLFKGLAARAGGAAALQDG